MLQYAILTLLQDGADHGYRLKRRLDQLLGPAWRVNVGQVYQVLDRLRRARLVEELPCETDRGHGHARWPVAITPAGETELERWRTAPIHPTRPPGPARYEVLGRLCVGGPACLEQILDGLLEERSVYALEYDRVAARCNRLEETGGSVDSAELLALEASRLAIRAHVEWIDLCFTRLAPRQASVPSLASKLGQISSWAPSSTTRFGGIPK